MSIALWVLLEVTSQSRLELEYEWSLVWKKVSVCYLVVVPLKLIITVGREGGAILLVLGRVIAKANLAFPA